MRSRCDIASLCSALVCSAGTQSQVYVNLALGRDFSELVYMDILYSTIKYFSSKHINNLIFVGIFQTQNKKIRFFDHISRKQLIREVVNLQTTTY
jgi:hypothetical protein